jgi:hypothetical protein
MTIRTRRALDIWTDDEAPANDKNKDMVLCSSRVVPQYECYCKRTARNNHSLRFPAQLVIVGGHRQDIHSCLISLPNVSVSQ